MLKGDAKAKYMREYMRRKRAGLITRKEPLPPDPLRHIDHIKYWVRRSKRRPWQLSRLGRKIIEGLDLDVCEGERRVVDGLEFNDWDAIGPKEHWLEACRRYRQHKDEQKARKKAEKGAAKSFRTTGPAKFCDICGAFEGRLLVRFDYGFICEDCVAEASRVLAVAKQSSDGTAP
jgi:hypothetical protein